MDEKIQQFYYKSNRIQQLKGFYHTAQEGTITKAAEVMGLTPSTVSLQIKTLERDLDCILFVRKTDKMELTEDGKTLYQLASPCLQQMDSIYRRFKNEKERTNKEIHIGIHHIAISYLLPKYLKTYSNLHKDIKIVIHNIAINEAFERLKRDKLDFLIYPISNVSVEFDTKKLKTYEPLLIMNKNHPLANIPEEEITLEKIAKHKLVRIDAKQIVLPMFEDAVKHYGIGSNIEFENGEWQMLKRFVEEEVGLALVSTICYDKNRDKNTVGKKLSRYFPGMTYNIITKKNAYIPDFVEEFINMFLKDL